MKWRPRTASRCVAVVVGVCLPLTCVEAIQLHGVQSCGVWVHDRSTKDDDYVKTWLLGYLSGLAEGYEQDYLLHADNQSIYLWMDNYCQANPLEHIGAGADQLAVELIKKMKGQAKQR